MPKSNYSLQRDSYIPKHIQKPSSNWTKKEKSKEKSKRKSRSKSRENSSRLNSSREATINSEVLLTTQVLEKIENLDLTEKKSNLFYNNKMI